MSDPSKLGAGKRPDGMDFLNWLRDPGPEQREARKRALDAAAANNALAVLERPAAGELLVELELCISDPVLGPHKLSEVLKQLAPIVLDYGRAAFDNDKVSLALSNAAVDALDLYYKDVIVTLDVGPLLKVLASQNMLENVANVMSACKLALLLHVEDMRVQELYRRVMQSYGYGCLDHAHVVMVERALANARRLMLQDAPLTSKEVLKCLTHLLTNAQFVLMCSGQCLEYTEAVAQYAIWCLAGCRSAQRAAASLCDKEVGLQACALLFKMAAGCMQQNSERLVEKDRQWMCSKGLLSLLFDFDMSFDFDIDENEHITWLMTRLRRTSLGVPGEKRSRGEGGAA